MSKPTLHSFTNRDSLTAALAEYISTTLTKAVAEKGVASLIVSGGSTPKPLFQSLSNMDLPWDKIQVTLADERWVDNTHSDSNEKLVSENLLQNKAAAAKFIALKNDKADAFEGQADADAAVAAMPELFDIVILGMGEDGHTASFFPGADELQDAISMTSGNSCQAVVPKTAPHARMTLTLPRLLAAQNIILHLTGQSKLDVYEVAAGEGAVDEMPVRSVLRQDATPVEVYWAP